LPDKKATGAQLAVTYYGVTAENIATVSADKAYSVCEERNGYTDFAKVAFTITTTAGSAVTIQADRCGGNNSQAIVTDGDGKEVFRSITPDGALEAKVASQLAAEPEVMPYFFLQHDDYVSLKARVAAKVLSGEPGTPEGVATIAIAIETMKVAEKLTPMLTEQLL
jgi:hypothetical protein